MLTKWLPGEITEDLISLSRSLGEPGKDLVILAEGNVSQRLDGGRMAIKTSGSYLSKSTRDDFVVIEIESLINLLNKNDFTQEELIGILDAGEHAGKRRRASIETLVHAAVYSVSPTGFIAHTHPTSAISLLSSVHAETAFQEWVYSDEAIVIGIPLFVPYAEPGVKLGRLFMSELRKYFQTHGKLPSLILLGNHGIVAIAGTAEAVEAITLMAVKGARIRLDAKAAGGVTGLDEKTISGYFLRSDMAERRRALAGTEL